jgi:hypothetical protein
MNPTADKYAALVERMRAGHPPRAATIKNTVATAGKTLDDFVDDIAADAPEQPAIGALCTCGQSVLTTRSSRTKSDGSTWRYLWCAECRRTVSISDTTAKQQLLLADDAPRHNESQQKEPSNE